VTKITRGEEKGERYSLGELNVYKGSGKLIVGDQAGV